jgi:hypothetical protein
MYENRTEPIITFPAYIKRQLLHLLFALGIIVCSLLIGVIGYHLLEGLSWIDSLLNASMILGGMGPVNGLQTNAGKVFASLYALYSGIVFLVVAGVIFAPVLHRVLHRFHLEDETEESSKE